MAPFLPENLGPRFHDISFVHRSLWTDTAQSMGLGIVWHADVTQNHTIDGYQDLQLSASAKAKYNVDAIPFEKNTLLINDITSVAEKLEIKRSELIQWSVQSRPLYQTTPDISHLTLAEREVIRRLYQAMPLLDKLDVMLKDDRGLSFLEELEKTGDENSLTQFLRLARNAATNSLEKSAWVYASPISWFPNYLPRYGTTSTTALIPLDLTEEEFSAAKKEMSGFAKDPTYNPYLSPFTVIYPDASSAIGWGYRKVNQDPRFQKDVAKLADMIEHAAQTPDIDVSLQKQLLATVESLRSDDPFAQYKEDAAWVVQSTGNLEISVGLGGGYTPMDKVNGAGLSIGIERKGAADFMRRELTPRMQKLEEKFTDLMGRDVYQPRQIKLDNVIRVVDMIVSSSGKDNVTLAFVGPDSGALSLRPVRPNRSLLRITTRPKLK